ncbi:oogenesin-1-like [Psammomys obesus]|uniref:oogenesin-1-like n=1 Tax=Psammomys obesus TaxID=48139 RepID=UPI0024533F4D|nr:oogenesin-1-like [Psammomys obesus]
MQTCLKKPWEALSITYCHLSQSDSDYLPCCPNICELKHLNLSALFICDFFLKPLGLLLERVRHSLQSLRLEWFRMEDPQFSALLPALGQGSQLTNIIICGNTLSLPVLKQLLYHTAKLSQITQELYPAPLEYYNDVSTLLIDRFDQLCPEILDTLRDKRQPKRKHRQATSGYEASSACREKYELKDQHVWSFKQERKTC